MQAIWNLTSRSMRCGQSLILNGLTSNFASGMQNTSALSTLCSIQSPGTTIFSNLQSPLMTSVRHHTRDYWPRPNEVKRIRKHGWKKRMSTPEGRKIIMKRILKGRYILTH